MPKKANECNCGCGCGCGRGRFWWGVLAGIVVTAIIRCLICGNACGMMGGACSMMKGGPAQVEKK